MEEEGGGPGRAPVGGGGAMAARAPREGGVVGMGGAGGLEARSVGLSTKQRREIPESTLEGGSPGGGGGGGGQEERMCRLENG